MKVIPLSPATTRLIAEENGALHEAKSRHNAAVNALIKADFAHRGEPWPSSGAVKLSGDATNAMVYDDDEALEPRALSLVEKAGAVSPGQESSAPQSAGEGL